MHRLLLAPALACAVFSSAASFAGNYESAFPYEVQTVAADVQLRCGPGDAFYVTELLGLKHTLTVYRQTAGGWLAVRPTDASYSLLAARYARATTDQDVVEVVNDHAVSWVGSSEVASSEVASSEVGSSGVGSSDIQPNELKWQVRFKPGEKVMVLGEETRRTYPGAPLELHYRIAPPAGEFRWIHEKDVRHASQVKIDEPAPRETIQLTDFQVVVEEPDAEPPRDGFVARKPRTPTTTATPADDATTKDATENSSDRPRLSRRARREPVVPQADLPPLTEADFEKRLRDLDVKLSLMVSQPAADWQLAKLREEVDGLIVRGETTVDRARAQLLAEKMDEFEQLHSRYKTTGVTAASANVAKTPADVEPAQPPTPTGVDPRFDGSGWLYPVHSRNQASPPYALLDADGAILQFVSPAPGLNLHRYLKKEIGVFGQQATISSLDKPHVTAQRVVSLNRHRR